MVSNTKYLDNKGVKNFYKKKPSPSNVILIIYTIMLFKFLEKKILKDISLFIPM